MPGTRLGALYTFMHFSPTAISEVGLDPHFIDEETEAPREGVAGSRPHNWGHTCCCCGGWALGPPAGSPGVKVRVELVAGYRISQSPYTARLVWAPSCFFPREAGLLLSVGVDWGWCFAESFHFRLGFKGFVNKISLLLYMNK